MIGLSGAASSRGEARHVVSATAERPARRLELGLPRHEAPWPRHSGAAAGRRPGVTAGGGYPIIVVQAESFFDARRLSPHIPGGLLTGFAGACAAGRSRSGSAQWG